MSGRRVVTISGSPGYRSTAGVVRFGEGNVPSLIIGLDSAVDVMLTAAPFPDGLVALANFCRVLSRESARLAAEIDPDGEPAPPEYVTGRHHIVSNPYGDSGAGH